MSRYPKARFVKSAVSAAAFGDDSGYEVAIAGRSNSGKSSALNAILRRRDLARTSRTPGRTQAVNLFELEPGRRLADLPGYGHARVPDAVKAAWGAADGRVLRGARLARGPLDRRRCTTRLRRARRGHAPLRRIARRPFAHPAQQVRQARPERGAPGAGGREGGACRAGRRAALFGGERRGRGRGAGRAR